MGAGGFGGRGGRGNGGEPLGGALDGLGEEPPEGGIWSGRAGCRFDGEALVRWPIAWLSLDAFGGGLLPAGTERSAPSDAGFAWEDVERVGRARAVYPFPGGVLFEFRENRGHGTAPASRGGRFVFRPLDAHDFAEILAYAESKGADVSRDARFVWV